MTYRLYHDDEDAIGECPIAHNSGGYDFEFMGTRCYLTREEAITVWNSRVEISEFNSMDCGFWTRHLIRNKQGGCIGADMICSECGKSNGHDEMYEFCPHCGKKMSDRYKKEWEYNVYDN